MFFERSAKSNEQPCSNLKLKKPIKNFDYLFLKFLKKKLYDFITISLNFDFLTDRLSAKIKNLRQN